MLVKDVYQENVVTIHESATLREAAELCISSQSSDIMICDSDHQFVGICSEGDLIRKAMPKYSELIEQGLSLDDAFDIFVEKGKQAANDSVMSVAIVNPVTVTRNTNLQKAASTMVSKNIRRLPVVENGKLIGSISRAMIAKAIFSQ